MAINLTMQKRGLPLSYVATAGNQAQLGIADLGRPFWKTRASRRWACISKASGHPALKSSRVWPSQKKGIVAIKVGQSEQAQAATISHTASIAKHAGAGGAQRLE